MSISSQLIYALWSCVRPGITHTHTHPGHCGTKQVFAQLIPASEAKAIYYLSDCLVLYVRKEAAISALEALVPRRQISLGYDKTMSDVLNVKLSKTTATSIFIPVLPGTYSTADLTLNRLYYPVGSSDTTAGGRTLSTYDGAKETLVVERGKITKITECALTLN